MFFGLSTFALTVLLTLIVGMTTAAGALLGRWMRSRPGASHESVGVIQGTLLGLIGLLLAFGLTMAVGRYEARRALVVREANTIGTTYLRAQLLPEPARTRSLELLKPYTDAAIELADQVPFTDAFDAGVARIEALQRDLWAATGDAVRADPAGTAPRVYIETLNEMIDTHTDRVASLRNRVPTPVMLLQVVGSAVALGVLALYLALLGRSVIAALLAVVVVIVILFVSFDLDRPQRGFIRVPFTVLTDVRASMDQPPAAVAP